jgi:hypothetical protein
MVRVRVLKLVQMCACTLALVGCLAVPQPPELTEDSVVNIYGGTVFGTRSECNGVYRTMVAHLRNELSEAARLRAGAAPGARIGILGITIGEHEWTIHAQNADRVKFNYLVAVRRAEERSYISCVRVRGREVEGAAYDIHAAAVADSFWNTAIEPQLIGYLADAVRGIPLGQVIVDTNKWRGRNVDIVPYVDESLKIDGGEICLIVTPGESMRSVDLPIDVRYAWSGDRAAVTLLSGDHAVARVGAYVRGERAEPLYGGCSLDEDAMKAGGKRVSCYDAHTIVVDLVGCPHDSDLSISVAQEDAGILQDADLPYDEGTGMCIPRQDVRIMTSSAGSETSRNVVDGRRDGATAILWHGTKPTVDTWVVQGLIAPRSQGTKQ